MTIMALLEMSYQIGLELVIYKKMNIQESCISTMMQYQMQKILHSMKKLERSQATNLRKMSMS
jgi:hypothetical protein